MAIDIAIELENDFDLSSKEAASLLLQLNKWIDTSQLRSLGSGTQGNAYVAGSIVLKLTADKSEAMACALIRDNPHPNLYRVHKVAKYRPADVYCVMYDYVLKPSTPLQNIAIAYDFLDDNDIALFYHWNPSNYSSYIATIIDYLQRLGETEMNLISIARMNLDDIERILLFLLWNGQTGTHTSFLGKLKPNKWLAPLKAVQKPNNPVMQYVDDINRALTHLHSIGIDYCDINETNVGESNGHCILFDVGYAEVSNQRLVDL